MTFKSFVCPYANRPLPSHPKSEGCTVGSCGFNLEPSPLSRRFKRCFLLYTEQFKGQRYGRGAEMTFSNLPRRHREAIVKVFMKASEEDLSAAYRDFYIAFFTILAEDTIVSLPKIQLDPIPYCQCVVCGDVDETRSLFVPQSGLLPPGYGYCSYRCFQLKPPPIIALERILEVDFRLLSDNLEFETIRNRPKFVWNLITWVLGGMPLK